jgi:hypothetical protein
MISRVVVCSTVAVVTPVCAGAVVVAVVVVVSVSLSVVVVSRAEATGRDEAGYGRARDKARKMVSFAALRRIRVDRMLPAGGPLDVTHGGRNFGHVRGGASRRGKRRQRLRGRRVECRD